MTHPVPAQPAADAALEENVDLDLDRKAEILSLDRALGGLNHFEVLGLAPGASAAEVKRAYHEASRRYHPDRYFQKNLGSFRARIERIFKRISDANTVLTDPKLREEYEKIHPELVARAPEPLPASAEDLRRGEERRARFAKHPYLIKGARLTDLIARSKSSVKSGDFGTAYRDLHTASQLDPKNHEVHSLLTEVRHKHELQRASEEMQRGVAAENSGDLNTALRSFLGAANLEKKNALAASKAAALMLKLGWDPKEARVLAQRAVDLEPEKVDHRFVLAAVLEVAGMKKLAARHFEEAVKMNPHHPEAKKRAKTKKSRWPF